MTNRTKNIIFYTIPANGHITPALPVISRLVSVGYDVVAYSTGEYQPQLEAAGAQFRPYKLGRHSFEATDGSNMLPLISLILEYTRRDLPRIITEAQALDPVLIIHDTYSLWGRMTADALGTPAASFNTIQTIYGIHSESFKMYFGNYAAAAVKLHKISTIEDRRTHLKNLYGLENSDYLSLLMNREKLNIFTYPRSMHPDGDSFGSDCFFAGAVSRLRDTSGGHVIKGDNIIYVSLGSNFNKSLSFCRTLIKEFAGTKYDLLVSCRENYGRLSHIRTPDNIILTPYADQNEMLSRAKLFITAGGINSLCEAAAAGVPCLMVPQTGEQRVNTDMMQRIGGGIISHGLLYEESAHLIHAFRKNDKLVAEFSGVHLDQLCSVLEQYSVNL